MLWRDVVELIAVRHSNDDDVSVTESARSVFANKKSVRQSEFYQAIANGIKPIIAFEIRSVEYEDEQKIRHEGQEYLVIRTYSNNGEIVELTCQAYDDVRTNLARLRDMVEIWRNEFVENSMGEQSPKPERLYTVQAHIEYAGGGTSDVDGTIETTNNATVTIVFREGITEDMFLLIDGKRYEIRFIEDPYNRHATLILTVERVVP